MDGLKTLIALPAIAVGLSGCNTMLINDRPACRKVTSNPC